ncbi:hypothetical protein HDU76_007614 [Blyttiomyces sp. JEL0837]|nr:hypothetical protein HDU76_007614 [Blyttiomyces sp. JEL0837]
MATSYISSYFNYLPSLSLPSVASAVDPGIAQLSRQSAGHSSTSNQQRQQQQLVGTQADMQSSKAAAAAAYSRHQQAQMLKQQGVLHQHQHPQQQQQHFNQRQTHQLAGRHSEESMHMYTQHQQHHVASSTSSTTYSTMTNSASVTTNTAVNTTASTSTATSTSRFDTFEDLVDSNEADEYGPEIAEFMREMELLTMSATSYMDRQVEITWKLRKTLVIWMIEVHAEYDLRPETLYLAVNYLDRVCSKRVITKQQYQLLGITSLWVAAKYEENHGRVPTLKNLIYICCGTYQEREFILMEQIILGELNFTMGHPTAESFLKAHCKYLRDVAPVSRALARLIMEVTLVHKRFLAYRPSLVATASLIMAEALQAHRYYAHSDPVLARVLSNLEDCLSHPPKQIVEKYKSGRYLHVGMNLKSWMDAKPNFKQAAAHAEHPLHIDTSVVVTAIRDQTSGLLTPPKESPNGVRWDAPYPAPIQMTSDPHQLTKSTSQQSQQQPASATSNGYHLGKPPLHSQQSLVPGVMVQSFNHHHAAAMASAASSVQYSSSAPQSRIWDSGYCSSGGDLSSSRNSTISSTSSHLPHNYHSGPASAYLGQHSVRFGGHGSNYAQDNGMMAQMQSASNQHGGAYGMSKGGPNSTGILGRSLTSTSILHSHQHHLQQQQQQQQLQHQQYQHQQQYHFGHHQLQHASSISSIASSCGMLVTPSVMMNRAGGMVTALPVGMGSMENDSDMMSLAGYSQNDTNPCGSNDDLNNSTNTNLSSSIMSVATGRSSIAVTGDMVMFEKELDSVFGSVPTISTGMLSGNNSIGDGSSCIWG